MEPETFVKIHGAIFCNYYLKLPEDFDEYKFKNNLGDANEFFDDVIGFDTVREKIQEYVSTLNDEDKVKFFNNDFTLEQINLELAGEADGDLYDRIVDYYFDDPWSNFGYDVLMYKIHKEFIKDKINQRDKQIDEILAD